MGKIAKAKLMMLYILGEYYRHINRRFNTPFLKVSLTKTEYISVVKNSGVVSKQDRAIYKNLEDLEKDRLLKYDHSMLKFTLKGKKEYEKLCKELDLYLKARERLEKRAKKVNKGQMVFMGK